MTNHTPHLRGFHLGYIGRAPIRQKKRGWLLWTDMTNPISASAAERILDERKWKEPFVTIMITPNQMLLKGWGSTAMCIMHKLMIFLSKGC